jgi:hypothetical protein
MKEAKMARRRMRNRASFWVKGLRASQWVRDWAALGGAILATYGGRISWVGGALESGGVGVFREWILLAGGGSGWGEEVIALLCHRGVEYVVLDVFDLAQFWGWGWLCVGDVEGIGAETEEGGERECGFCALRRTGRAFYLHNHSVTEKRRRGDGSG